MGRISSGMWWRSCLVWLLVACGLGIAQSASIIEVLSGYGGGDVGNVGLLILAREGAMLYGFVWSFLMAAGRMFCPGMERNGGAGYLLAGIWTVFVGGGMVSVLAGYGSGIPVMPFASWMMPPLLVVAAIQLATLSRRIGREAGKGDKAGGACVVLAGGILWGCMAAGYWCQLDGGPAAGQFAVFICLKQAWMIVPAIAGSALFLNMSGVSGWKAWVPLAFLTVFAGDAGSWALPVAPSWWNVPGSAVWLGGGALLLVLVSVWGCGHVPVRRWGFWLFCLLLWVIGHVFVPDSAASFQFSPVNWYGPDAALLLVAGVPFMMWLTRVWTMRMFGCGILVFLAVFVFAAAALVPGVYVDESGRNALLNLGLLIVSACFSVAWLLMLVSLAWELWITFGAKIQSGEGGSIPMADAGGTPVAGRGFVTGLLIAGAAVPVVSSIGMFLTGEALEFQSKRPGFDRQGAALYASEGCGVCHTQIVRRVPDGRDLQQSVYRNGNGDGVARVSEPEDWSSEGGEGMPHVGWVRQGPDLFQLGAWAEQKVRFTDQDGQGRILAHPEEWLMLHLYNPRDRRFGNSDSLCPSLAGWFKVIPRRAGTFPENSLPVHCPAGMEVVPGEKIRHLVNYLMSLKRGNMVRPDMVNGVLQVVPDSELNTRSHVSSSYAGNPPVIDTSRREKTLDALVLRKGRQLYASKCTLCHGADGRGDGVNYPPLEGSEWIDKEASIMARIVRNGVTGKIQVTGRMWNSTMLPPGVASPEEAAAVMTYVRRRFGDAGSPRISAEQVRTWWKQYGSAPYRATDS